MIIYKVTNLINGKTYIGQTIKTFNNRIKKHKEDVKYNNSKLLFHNALRKYGFDKFNFEEIDNADSIEELDYLETYWIKFWHSNDRRFGYNLTNGGGGSVGYKHTEEAKKKMSLAKIGKYIGKNNPSFGRKMSEENKHRMSESRKGQRTWNKGVLATDEHKEKLKLAWSKTKVRIRHTQKHSEETKEKIRQKHLGKKHNYNINLRKKIICIETGIIYNSIVEASKETGISRGNISSVLGGHSKTAKGKTWRYVND